MGQKVYGGESSHLPLKINTAGVIPAIFASALLLAYQLLFQILDYLIQKHLLIYLPCFHKESLYICCYMHLV